jgi:hypothetical protein
LKANIVYQLEVFTSNEEVTICRQYHDSPVLNLYVEVSNGGVSQVEFSFYNESSIDSSIARIYFDDDDGSLLGIADIAGFGVSFSQSAVPGNLPGAKLLDPAFETTSGFSIDADSPPPKNGINPGEWGIISFDLTNDGTLKDVISGLNTNILRVGVHVIGLPDGSSISAVSVPEPGTLMLLGTAGLWIFTRKRRSFEGKTNSAANASLMKVSES